MWVRDNIAAGKYENKVPYSIEKIPVHDSMTLKEAREHEASEKQRKMDQRQAWRNEHSRLMQLFRADLETEHNMTGNPRADRLWELAYVHGHSSGYNDIAGYYEDFVELVI